MHTLVIEQRITLETTPDVDLDYRYGTGPDQMELCAFCTGQLLVLLLGFEKS